MNGRVFTNRYEVKYLVKTSQVPFIKKRLGELLEPDPYNRNEEGYYNHSIYFDSPSHIFYQQKNEGLEKRVKPRLRIYRSSLDSEPLRLYLEFKERHNRIVKKQRQEISPAVANYLLNSMDSLDDETILGTEVLNRFSMFKKKFRIEPRVTVIYNRSAYFSPYYQNVRITYDRGIHGSIATHLAPPLTSLISILPPEQTMIELKYNDKLPRIFFSVIKELQLRQVTFSKYGVTLENCLLARKNRYRISW